LFGSQNEDVVSNVNFYFDSSLDAHPLEKAIWAIANIAGTSSKFRDLCLQKDYMEKLLQTLERSPTSFDIIDRSFHAICNLSLRKPFSEWQKILPALPILYKYICEVRK